MSSLKNTFTLQITATKKKQAARPKGKIISVHMVNKTFQYTHQTKEWSCTKKESKYSVCVSVCVYVCVCLCVHAHVCVCVCV